MSTHARRAEPKQRVLTRSEIPATEPLQPPKGYWNSVVEHLTILGADKAIELTLKDDQDTASMKSALHTAACG